MHPDSPTDNQQPPLSDTTPVADDQANTAVDEPVDDDVLLQWSITDTSTHHRPTVWYIIIGVIAAATIVIAIFTRAWIYIPLGILVPWALSIYVNKGIGDHSYSLTTFTVGVDDKHHPYTDFSSFFIAEYKEFITFELVPSKRFANLISLHTTEEQAEDVAEILSSVLPETEPKGYVGESVFKRLKL